MLHCNTINEEQDFFFFSSQWWKEPVSLLEYSIWDILYNLIKVFEFAPVLHRIALSKHHRQKVFR